MINLSRQLFPYVEIINYTLSDYHAYNSQVKCDTTIVKR